MIRLVCMDLDGVLVDAVEWHYESLNLALQETCGFVLNREEHLTTYNGLPTKVKLGVLAKEGRVREEDIESICELKQKYTKECILKFASKDEEKIALHKYLKEQNISIVCVTNSITETATYMLKATGQFDYIDKLIANDMVKNAKPHPEGYLKAMIEFNVPPKKTLIIEDSPKGLEAAYASGANVCKVKDCSEVNINTIVKYLESL